MKLSQGFWQTFKETPNDAVVPSHKLMIRAGLIHKGAGGLYNALPMGLRVFQKVSNIVRDELNKAGCYEVAMTVMTPGELWMESGRFETMGNEMLKVKDRAGRFLCVSPTNEEAITDIFRKSINSYKQLPVTLYQINTKFRDEIRPRYGVMRGREFTMKDAYSFHVDFEDMHITYDKMFKVYENIFKRMGLKFIAVEADGGAMADGEAKTHEFQVLASAGEDRVIKCKKCEYAANIEKAHTVHNVQGRAKGAEPMSKVDTPNVGTIDEVCKFLKVDESTSLKSLVYIAITGEEEKMVLCLVVGDDNLNELKLKTHLKCDHLKAATDNDMQRMHLPKGYIGPHGDRLENVTVLFDKSIDLNAAYVVGAMETDKHSVNFVPNRDAVKFEVADLRESKAGDQCSLCEGEVEEIRGIEVGHIFELGNKYTKAMNVTVLDKNGKSINPQMGCYGLGIERTAASAIEQHHDDNGIVWPKAIAPYHIHFVRISKDEEINKIADEICSELEQNSFEVVYDDRSVSPGFKFKDADLLGLPIRLVLGERDYKKDGMLEIKLRAGGETFKVERENLLAELKKLWEDLK